MTENIDLYYVLPSPPCRSVMLVAKALGVKLNLKMVNIMEGEHLQPEFLKINPEHTIPTLNDKGLIMWESRAIMCYLANAYDKDGALYPKDPRKRAIVDQRLYFDGCTLFSRLIQYFGPVIRGLAQPEASLKLKFEESLNTLDNSLKTSKWVAGDQLTLADIAIVVTIATAEEMDIDISKYSYIMSWYQRCKNDMAKFDYEEINQKGAIMLGQFFKSKIN